MNKPKVFIINKAKVVLYQVENVRSIQISCMVKCGGWYENSNNLGISHFLEHMLFQGTKNLPTPEIMAEFAKENGIYPNAFTSGKMINFYLEIPDVNLDKGLKAFEETIFNPIIPQEKIKKELDVITQEFLSKWDKPESRFYKKINEHLFGKDHTFCRDTLGQIDNLKKITSNDLKKVHQQYFQPQNMVIAITGNFGSIPSLKNKLVKILNKYFNTFKSKLEYQPIKPSSQKIFIHQDKPNQDTIILNWILEKNKKSNRLQKISNSIFNNLFGNGPDSLLFKTFRLKYGLVYNIRSSIFYYKNCSFFEISCQIDPSKSQQFLNILEKELPDLFNQINKKMFDRTIKFMNYQTLMSYDSINEINSVITNEAFNYKKIFLPEDQIDLTKKINFKKTFSYFNKKINWKNKYIFIMTPTKPENI